MLNKGVLQELFDKDTKIVIYGAGLRGDIISKTLVSLGIDCLYVIDRDESKHGKNLNGITITGLDSIKALTENFSILVSVVGGESIVEELKQDYRVLPIDAAEYVIRLSFLCCEDYGYKSIEGITHFMSPFPDARQYSENAPVMDIDFNEELQQEYFDYFVDLYKKIQGHEGEANRRYYEDNTKYGVIDALALHGMICRVKPMKIIEIGSGFSSAAMLDTNEYIFDNSINLQFVEPFPGRLLGLLKESDEITLYENFLQEVDKIIFTQLEENDILFVDSSHMGKMGSDVNEIFFEILPRLKSGVYIHFHDIFNNFEYPKEWVEQGRVWNEAYFLRAFLMNNKDYEVIFFCNQWKKEFDLTGLFEGNTGGGSLWLRKK